MHEMSEGKQFTNQNRSRQKAEKQMGPLIQKIESEFSVVLEQARQIKNKFNEVLKFQSQKLTLQKNIKEVRRDLHETNSHLASVKAESELGISKLASNVRTVKDELNSLERIVQRRQEYFENYDKKLNNIMQALSKHQAYVNDRLYVFEDKFKSLTKQTLEMTKDIKKDFDNTMTTNIILKNELVHKIKNTEEKQKILDLYMSEREQIPKKINDIYNDLKNYLKHNQFQQFKIWHQSAIEESLSKAQKTVQKILPQSTQQNLKKIQQKFHQIQQLHEKNNEVEVLKLQIEALSRKIDSMQRSEDLKITQIREQAEQIEEKIIEVIDKKIETIEQQMENYNNHNQESVDQKLQRLREELIKLIHQPKSPTIYEEEVQAKKVQIARDYQKEEEPQIVISKEIEIVRRQRELIQQNSKEIRSLAEGLNSKLSLFSNKITMCRSDIEIFAQNTSRELKKIIDIRRQEENHMQSTGKMLADLTQSVCILASIMVNEEKGQPKSYVTYNDGIILQLNVGSPKHMINYRKHQVSCADLKESLILSLVHRIDEIITSRHIFRWDLYKPSSFFSKIKQHLNIKSKAISKSASVNLHSPRRKKKATQDLFLDFKMQSDQLLKNINNKPVITMNSTNMLWGSQKPKSEMQKRYKIKKNQQKEKETEERNCFTAFKSHRKSKMIFN